MRRLSFLLLALAACTLALLLAGAGTRPWALAAPGSPGAWQPQKAPQPAAC